MAEARHPTDMVAAGAGSQRNGLRSITLANGEHAVRDLIERIVPGNALPPAGLTFALAPQRIFQPVRMVDKVGGHRPDRAQAAMIDRRGAVALHLPQHTVPDMQQDAATAVATAANALEHRGGRIVGYQT